MCSVLLNIENYLPLSTFEFFQIALNMVNPLCKCGNQVEVDRARMWILKALSEKPNVSGSSQVVTRAITEHTIKLWER